MTHTPIANRPTTGTVEPLKISVVTY